MGKLFDISFPNIKILTYFKILMWLIIEFWNFSSKSTFIIWRNTQFRLWNFHTSHHNKLKLKQYSKGIFLTNENYHPLEDASARTASNIKLILTLKLIFSAVRIKNSFFYLMKFACHFRSIWQKTLITYVSHFLIFFLNSDIHSK